MSVARRTMHLGESLWVWRQRVVRSALSPAARQVLLTVAHHMHDGVSSCFVAPRTLVTETGLTAEAVAQALGEAMEAGFIEARAVEGRQVCVSRMLPTGVPL